jgi:hypothetical protein
MDISILAEVEVVLSIAMKEALATAPQVKVKLSPTELESVDRTIQGISARIARQFVPIKELVSVMFE